MNQALCFLSLECPVSVKIQKRGSESSDSYLLFSPILHFPRWKSHTLARGAKRKHALPCHWNFPLRSWRKQYQELHVRKHQCFWTAQNAHDSRCYEKIFEAVSLDFALNKKKKVAPINREGNAKCPWSITEHIREFVQWFLSISVIS